MEAQTKELVKLKSILDKQTSGMKDMTDDLKEMNVTMHRINEKLNEWMQMQGLPPFPNEPVIKSHIEEKNQLDELVMTVEFHAVLDDKVSNPCLDEVAYIVGEATNHLDKVSLNNGLIDEMSANSYNEVEVAVAGIEGVEEYSIGDCHLSSSCARLSQGRVDDEKPPNVETNEKGSVPSMDLVLSGEYRDAVDIDRIQVNTLKWINGAEDEKIQHNILLMSYIGKENNHTDDPYWTTILTSAIPVQLRFILSHLTCASNCVPFQFHFLKGPAPSNCQMHIPLFCGNCIRRRKRIRDVYGFNGPGSSQGPFNFALALVRDYDGFNGPGNSQVAFTFMWSLVRFYDGFNGPGFFYVASDFLWAILRDYDGFNGPGHTLRTRCL